MKQISSRRRLVLAFCGLASVAIAQNVNVDASAPPGGDGSRRAPFNSIETAVAYANGLPGTPLIGVAPGHYPVSSTLLIPKGMIIRGSNTMKFDSQGFPTGADPATESRIVGTAASGSHQLVFAGQDGKVTSPFEIDNLTFEGGPGNGDVINLTGVQGLEIRDCVFVGSSTLTAPTSANGIRTFASSGEIRDSYMSGLAAGAVMRGGSPASPAVVVFRNNRSVGHANGGVLLSGTSDSVLQPGNQLIAIVQDNDLSGSVASPPSFGIRIFAKGNEDAVNAHLSTSNIIAVIQDNRVAGNNIGVSVDAGFPYRLVPPAANMVCDTRTFTSNFNLTFVDNTVTGSMKFNGLISFTREPATLKQPNAPLSQWQYLHNSTFSIIDPDRLFTGAKVDNPANDPFTGGPCTADVVSEPLHNLLTINGIPQAHTP